MNLYDVRGQKQTDGNLYEGRGQKQTDGNLYEGRSQKKADNGYASEFGSQSDEPYAVRKREPSQGQSAVSAFLAAELKAGESVFCDEAAEIDGKAFSAFQMPEPGQSEGGSMFRTPEGGQKETVEIEAPRGSKKRTEKIVEIPVPETVRETSEQIVVETPQPSAPSKNTQTRQTVQMERMPRREKTEEEVDRDVVIRRILEEFMA